MRRRGILAALFGAGATKAVPAAQASGGAASLAGSTAAIRSAEIHSRTAAILAWADSFDDSPFFRSMAKTSATARMTSAVSGSTKVAARSAAAAVIAATSPGASTPLAVSVRTRFIHNLRAASPEGSGRGVRFAINSSMGWVTAPMVDGPGGGSQRSAAGPNPIAPPTSSGGAAPAADTARGQGDGGDVSLSAPAAFPSSDLPVLPSGCAPHAQQHEDFSQ